MECKLPNGSYCAACCYDTEMPLTAEDLRRLESLGYRSEEFSTCKGGLLRLKNVDGHCVFLEPATGRCRVYAYRPAGCRLYPLVYNTYTGTVEVDKQCPRASEIPEEMVRRYAKHVIRLVNRVLREGACHAGP